MSRGKKNDILQKIAEYYVEKTPFSFFFFNFRFRFLFDIILSFLFSLFQFRSVSGPNPKTGVLILEFKRTKVVMKPRKEACRSLLDEERRENEEGGWG